ncbi:M43 family zinc metalloprotease [Chondrinema litorale]|uniref:M43 family zinc metalloprotease n=1 Tax=Chondrinema litorale TaxID=2994555 RepID=UPI002542D736|nr:M43 family zinc metalloprotease [Chondrinema litorale]UZR93805.1 M43 family zinc metalloprotease [Chondrinema litorale]
MEKLFPDTPPEQRKEAFTGFETWLKKNISQKHLKKGTEEASSVYVIPVVVHVIHNGEDIGDGSNIPAEQVLSQIEVLNQDFRRQNSDRENTPDVFNDVAADTKIEFRLAVIDPEGNVLDEPGIDRYNGGRDSWNDTQLDNDIKPLTSWNPTKYMNIWVADLGSSLLGYSSWPKSSGNDGVPIEAGNDNQDGVVINNLVFGSNYTNYGSFDNLSDDRYDRGRTCTHEVGHFFALLHPWGVVGGCSDDDYCDDTPTTSSDRDDVFSPCEFPDPDKPNTCTDDENDLPDMFQNFMDYTADACMNLFTMQQSERMQAVMENSPNRNELLSSQVITPHFAPSNLVITGNALEGYTIEWTDNSLNESGFIIEVSTDPYSGYTAIASIPANYTSYEASPGDGVFYYRIKAINQSGESDYSNPQATPNILPPDAPINLSVVEYSQDSILISWENVSDLATSIEIYVSEGSSDSFVLWLDDVSGNQDSIWVTGLSSETLYAIKIRGTNSAGDSDFSGTVLVTTLPYPPSASTGLSVLFDDDSRRLRLIWNETSDNEDGFEIYRSLDSLSGYEEVATVAANTSQWLDITFYPPPLSLYYYKIRAYNEGGYSAFSNIGRYDAISELEDAPLKSSLFVYPNPVSEVLYLNAVMDVDQEVQVLLTDITGKAYENIVIETESKVLYYEFEADKYPPGLYIVQVNTTKGRGAIKILIQ